MSSNTQRVKTPDGSLTSDSLFIPNISKLPLDMYFIYGCYIDYYHSYQVHVKWFLSNKRTKRTIITMNKNVSHVTKLLKRHIKINKMTYTTLIKLQCRYNNKTITSTLGYMRTLNTDN